MVIGLITLFDDYKSRSDDTKHTLKNNNILTPTFGGQFIPANYGHGHWLFNSLR